MARYRVTATIHVDVVADDTEVAEAAIGMALETMWPEHDQLGYVITDVTAVTDREEN